MSNQQAASFRSDLLIFLTSIFISVTGLVYFSGHYKILTLIAGAACLYLLLRRDLTPIFNLPALLFLAYISISGLTRLWAISGKFFLIEFSEIFVAAVFFLAVMLHQRFDRETVRSLMKLMAGVSGIYSLLSVEAASTGITKKILDLLLSGYQGISVGFEKGTRLTGIMGNANILSSILAIGIFCSICLACGEEKRKARLLYTGLTALNSFVFLLLFSMGGTACFILAVVCYLIFAGKGRSSVLVRMLECAVPTVVWVFVTFPFFNQSGFMAVAPLFTMAGNIITVVLLEALLGSRMSETLSRHSKLTVGVLTGTAVLACAFIVLGVILTGAYTFGGDSLRRSSYPAAGEHTLSIEASGPVNVTIISQDMSQVMMHTETVVYRGSAENAVFTVPENSEVCYFTFTADEGTVLETANLDSGETLKLKYTLLPGFIANRLQGLFANQNAIQRTVFFRDGMKMFRNSPIVGNGVGSFETGITSVQEFTYATKYIHNHYIQVLLEAGIVGFLPFAGALLCMVFLMLKRRKDTEWELSAEYPALWACLVMTLTHIAMEVSMSIMVFVWMAYVIFALVIRCSDPAPLRLSFLKGVAGRAVIAVLPVIFVLSLCCNLIVGRIAGSSVHTIDQFFDNMELAATLDPYEANDAKLSYVMQAFNNDQDSRMPKANEYAADLLEYQSNTIPSVLLKYYLYTAQYEGALKAANAAAVYSASNGDVWNEVIFEMAQIFTNNDSGSPLMSERHNQILMDGLLDYYRTLQTRNANSMETIDLSPASKDFFSRILALSQTSLSLDDVEFILENWLFNLSSFCDADNNSIPDQVSSHKGISFGESWNFSENGTVTLTLISRSSRYPSCVTIQCDDPQAITVTDEFGTSVEGTISDGVWQGELPEIQRSEEMTVTIHSSVPQQLTQLNIVTE